MVDVLCFGNLQFDVLCRPVMALPPPGGMQMLDAIDLALSGNGGNVAASLARLGISVELAGYSGADLIGEQFRVTLQDLGVGTSRLLCHPTVSTGTSIVTLSANGERSVMFVNGANALFDLYNVPDSWLDEKCVISVSSVFVLPQFSGKAVAALFARARSLGATTVLNISWDAQGQGLPYLRPALAETDYFVLSYDEGRQLTGEITAEKIVAELELHTRGTVLLTLGAEGCCLHDADGVRRIAAVEVTATDCTGAGDSFLAGFIAGIVSGLETWNAASLGCQVAAFAVTGPGAYPRIPPLEAITRISRS
ncbi:MAG: sugar kinase [Ktedonobacteraceae bacterium]